MKNYLSSIFKSAAAIIALLVCIAAAGQTFGVHADASSVSVVSVDYSTSTITLQLSSADNSLYLSDHNQKKWEYIPLVKDSNNQISFDISWVSTTKDNVLSFKADVSTTPIKVTIPKQVTNLRVSYSTLGNKFTFTNVNGRVLEWKKREGFTWNVWTDSEEDKEIIDSLSDNGAVLLFRLAGVNGTSASTPGMRPSKEVSVSVTKKTVAPSITVKDDCLAIPVVKGMQYRYADEDGNPIEPAGINGSSSDNVAWVNILKTELFSLEDIAAEAMLANNNNAPKKVYIQFRTTATSSKQTSNITTVEIPAQEPMPVGYEDNIKLVYTSSTTFELRIPYASAEIPYEYCIINQSMVKDGTTIEDVEELTWKPITSTLGVSINRDKDNVKDKSLVYVRRKAVKSLGDEAYKLASPYFLLGEVKYPGNISASDNSTNSLRWLTTVAGRCNKANTEGYITFDIYSPTNNIIKEIKFVDYSSTSTVATLTLAGQDIKSTVKENPDKTNPDKKYIITTTIMTTEKLDSVADKPDTRKLLAYITLEDSTEAFKSSIADGGIALYISPATKVNNPSAATEVADKNEIASYLNWSGYNAEQDNIDYTTSFVRVLNSNKYYQPGKADGTFDASAFRVRLDIGSAKVPNSMDPATFKNDDVEITAIKYDGVLFDANQTFKTADGQNKPAYTVEYAEIKNNYSEPTRMAVLTINADAIETSTLVDDRNKKTPVIIYLNNGEVLSNVVTLSLQETATIADGANSWTITEGSLKTVDTETTTSASGATTTSEKEHVDRTITLTVFKDNYDVTLESVTWNGISVCNNIQKQGNKITMNLSNSQINNISVTETTSHYLVFTFDNGFVIDSGWKLTINPSASK